MKFVATLLTVLTVGAALAADLPVTADVHVGPTTPQAGALPNLAIGAGNRALLRFDLSTLPPGLSPTQVVKATLVFHVNRIATAGPIRLSTLIGPFQELTATQATAPPAAVPFVQINPVQGLNLFDVTALVQQWITSPASAFGIDISPDPSGSASLLIDSRENIATSFPAEIRVVLSGPAGPQGPAGPTGPQGPQGPAGAAASPTLQTAVCELFRTASKPPPPGISCPTKLAFVTSSIRSANLGGLAGADAICNQEAAAAGKGGTFKAWLSTTTQSAAQRFVQSTVPIVRVDGALIAYDWADLTSGSIRAPINLTATGASITNPGPFSTWTNTTDTGAASSLDCVGWTSASSTLLGLGGVIVGTDASWTATVNRFCSTQLRLYCIQQ
ncbi:MAG: DNRLRE domain-containing protein [Bryobacterales bacterium]|nr:DNRLRE domain-containing protein [Bryobacterales bacterium]